MNSKTFPRISIFILILALCLQSLPFAQVSAQEASASNDQFANTEQKEDEKQPGPKKGIMMSDSAQPDNSSAAKQKLSPDLKQKKNSVSGGSFIDVIIQPAGNWSSALSTELTNRGAAAKKSFANFGFKSYKVKAKDIDNIANRVDVDYISLERPTKSLGHISSTTGSDAAKLLGGTTKYEGQGIGVAVLDSGIMASHVAFADAVTGAPRIKASIDFTGENRTDDPYGHGTHVAGMAVGNGAVSVGAYKGIASYAHLINLRVLNSTGKGTTTALLNALDWIYTNRANTNYNIKVVNLSLGTSAVDSYKNDPLCIAVRKLVDAGIVVVAAAGNEGKDTSGKELYGQIHSPGNDPSVITVGATNSQGTDSRFDDIMTSYSSRGPTRSFWTDVNGVRHYDNLMKPDLVAPGNKIVAPLAPGNYLVTNNPALDAKVSNINVRKQMYLSGTSMAAPAVSGAVALMLQANPKLTPNLVKMLLMYTAQVLPNYNHFEQGAGQLNIEGAVRLARLVRQDLNSTTPVGAPLLTSTTNLIPYSYINGEIFSWGQGVVLDHSFATGTNLITKYQKVYG